MAKKAATKKKDSLDKSIDLGMDQFGRFLKGAWFWLLSLLVLILFFTSVIKIPGVDGPSIFSLLLEFGFAVFYILIQFVALFWFLGRPRLYWVMPGETGVTFEDYKGNPEVLETARRMVSLLRGVKEFEAMGGKPVRGLLLSGPPGTGKSYLAQCMSTEAGVPFAYASAASFRAMFIGMDVLMISRLYRKARKLAREYGGCVVFMDEIDAIATSRTSRGGGTMAIGGGIMGGMGGTGGLNQLLMEMDPPNIETGWFKKVLRSVGLYHSRAQSEPVLTVGATNVPDSLDPALLRPGRFDRKLHVAPPTDKYRPEVIEYYLKKVQHEQNISVSALSARLVEYTPVAIKHVINEATILAHFDCRDTITYRDLIEAQDIHEYGLRQLSELTPIERRRLAYHEAGHTVAAYYLMDRNYPAFVTLHVHGDVEGAAAFAGWRPKETIHTRIEKIFWLVSSVSVASRAAEELFLNTQLNGVTGDFASATYLAVNISVHMVWMAQSHPICLCNGFGHLELPDLTKRVEVLLQSQLKAVKQLFMEHREALIAIAEALIERDELVAEEIKSLIDTADARKAIQTVLSEFTPLLEADTNGNGYRESIVNGYTNGMPSLPSPRHNAPLNMDRPPTTKNGEISSYKDDDVYGQ